MSDFRKTVLVDGSRTPIADFGRSLKREPVNKLAEHVVRHAMRRARVQPGQVDGLILGHAFQSSFTPNTARFVWLEAGFPHTTLGDTVQIQCGSGMKAVNDAMDQIRLGYGNLYVAGGAESMSTIPYLVDGRLRFDSQQSKPFKNFATEFKRGFMPKVVDFVSRRFDHGLLANFWNRRMMGLLGKFGPRPFIGVVEDGLMPVRNLWDARTTHMSGTAERLWQTYGITREQMDEYSLRSQERATAAIKSGRFALEIDAIQTERGFFSQDEHPRSTSMEQLGKLKGANRTKNITAGNASGINDGACALVVASDEYARAHGLTPLATLVDHVRVAVDPEQMGIGPVEAIRKLLLRNGLTIADIDLFEVNEAFAAQYLTCEKLLQLDRQKVNINGGAIALGHPIAMSGARIILTLAHSLRALAAEKKRKVLGVASLCIGGGMGIATLVEVDFTDASEQR